MNKENFDELWNKTVNNVMCGISARDIKGKFQINEYLRGIVWDHAWGNRKLVPPERKFLDDLSKESPQKAMEIESVLSNISVSNGWQLYAGILVALAGVIALFVTHGALRFVGGAVAIVGIGLALSGALQGNYNPQKAASDALAKAKDKCDKILL